MPDFYSLVNADAPTTDLQAALLALLDAILQSGKCTDDQADAIAKVRSQVAIVLKTL